jgi:uncharacterized protein YkwD
MLSIVGNAQIDNEKLQKDFVKELNIYRTSKGLPDVKLDSNCIQIAKYQSIYCAENNVLTHDTPKKNDLLDKLSYSVFAENGHSGGSVSATNILNSWIKSSGHNKNLLLYDVVKIGIYAAQESTKNKYYVFLVLTD